MPSRPKDYAYHVLPPQHPVISLPHVTIASAGKALAANSKLHASPPPPPSPNTHLLVVPQHDKQVKGSDEHGGDDGVVKRGACALPNEVALRQDAYELAVVIHLQHITVINKWCATVMDKG